MNCPYCNTPDPGTGKFCIRCGQVLPVAPAPSPYPYGVQPAPATPAPAWSAGQVAGVPAAPQLVQAVPQPLPEPPPQMAPPYWQPYAPATRVVVTDFNMTFQSMVIFLVKLALAAVPALIILMFIGVLILAIFGGIFGSILNSIL